MNDVADAIYDLLVAEAEAPEHLREHFRAFWLRDSGFTGEFRFGGRLGMGGKFWRRPSRSVPYSVNCYREDETPARLAIIERINTRLAEDYRS